MNTLSVIKPINIFYKLNININNSMHRIGCFKAHPILRHFTGYIKHIVGHTGYMNNSLQHFYVCVSVCVFVCVC